MSFELEKKVMSALGETPNTPMTSREISLWIWNNYQADCRKKLKKSEKLKTKQDLLSQVSAEIAALHSRLVQKHSAIHILGSKPRKYVLQQEQEVDHRNEKNPTRPHESENEKGDDVRDESFEEGKFLGTGSAKFSIIQKDRTLFQFHRWHEEGQIVVDPAWQRNFIWSTNRSSRLIESFMINVPVPVVYLAENENGKYEVIDGLQRLTSVFRFFRNEYALQGLEFDISLNGKKFKELSPQIQTKLQDATLRTFELSPDAPADQKFSIFERLNTGGVPLKEQEIRKFMYHGPLNNLLKDLSKDANFKTCVSTKGLEKRMIDQSLVLRFLAFSQIGMVHADKGLKSFLNSFMKNNRYAEPETLKVFEDNFRGSMKKCKTIFGDQGFRLRNRKIGSKSHGSWGSRVNAAIFQSISVSLIRFSQARVVACADSIYEEYMDMITSDEEWVSSVSSATGDPSRLHYSFSKWAERLEKCIDKTPQTRANRNFSRELKDQLFRQNKECGICGSRIVMVDDSAVDHIKQYWRGGHTIPENARLVHRYCNLARSKSD